MNQSQEGITEMLIERGNAAEQLLQSEVFQAAANALTNQYLDNILQSAPEDIKARESGYAQARAVRDMVGVLTQWVAHRDQAVASLNASEVDDEPEYEL